MAEIVKKGIEQANLDLEKENESRLLQEVCVVICFKFQISNYIVVP